MARANHVEPGSSRSVSRIARCAVPALAFASLVLAAPPAVIGQTPASAPPPVRLPAADAQRIAREVRQSITAQMAEGFALTLWAPTEFVTNAIGLDIDSDGTVYVVGSDRSGMPTDIRQHPDWVPEVHTLRTVDDLRQFFRRHLAPERSARNTWLPDRNQDGSHDWRDLTTYKERIYRIQDTDGDGLADVSQVVFEGFNDDPADDIAGGVLVHRGDLYVTAAPDLWRLRDTNGDGLMDVKTSISHGYSIHPAFSGHDMSGVLMGPDGRIYWKIGDIGMNVVDRTGRRWAYPNQGAILRANLDGSDFEVFATGLRNTQEFDFDDHGNLISVDNDGDHKGESERVVYITYGSDAGWRSTWQYGKYTDPNNNRYNVWMDEGLYRPRFEGQAAYIVPPVASYHSGPSGFVYNPGTALDDRWRGHFFVTSYTGTTATARVYAFRLTEQGAGFQVAGDTEVLRGVLAPGLKFGPDGALYLTDWIRGWEATGEGRVWKLDTPATAASPMRAEVRSLLRADWSARTAGDLGALLGHLDRRVRQKAQFDLVRRGEAAALEAAARAGQPHLTRIHALWGLGQLARTRAAEAARLVPLLSDPTAEIRAQAARMLGDARAPIAAEALIPLLDDSAPRPRFFAAEALGRLRHRAAVPAIVRMLAANDDRDAYLRHAGSLALAAIGDAGALTSLTDHPLRGVRLAAVVALRRMRDPGLARFLQDRDESVVTDAARAINDEGGVMPALSPLAALLDRSRFAGEPLMRRILNANLRVGTRDAAQRVGAYAARRDAPEALRAEAVAILGVWATPSPLDRVDGAQLAPLAPRDAEAARAAILPLVARLADADMGTSLKSAIIDSIGRLGITSAAPALVARLQDDATPAVRVAALHALQALEVPEIVAVLPAALADADLSVRMAAIGAVASLPLSDAARAQYLASVVGQGSVGEQQSALQALGGLKTPEAAARIGTFLDQIAAGAIAPDIQLELFEAARAAGAEPLLNRLDRLGVGRTLDKLASRFPEALMQGGAAARGRQVAQQHAAAQCVRCHTIGGQVSTIGPPLDGIASRLPREDLLTALIDPSARIAPGFGSVSLTLRNGQRVDGVLHEETGTMLSVEDGANVRHRIEKAAVATRTNLPSAMPPMGALLRPAEIRDVVAYLSTLK
jgi:putative membrane-bound dehydrogenase-like protein